MNYLKYLLAAFSVCGLLAAGCAKNNPAAPDTAPEQGKCRFIISAAEDVASGQVVLAKGQAQRIVPITITGHTGTVLIENLEVGTWNIDVKLFNASGDEIYSGQGTALVRKGQVTHVTIRVQANTGTLEITVEVPVDGGATPTLTPTATPALITYPILFLDQAGKLHSVNEDGSGLEQHSAPDMVIHSFDNRPSDNILFCSENNEINQLRFDGTLYYQLHIPGIYPRLSPSRTRLLVQQATGAGTNLVTYSSMGGAMQDLQVNVGPTGILRGCWTPDGRILYSFRSSNADQEILQIMNSDGSNKLLLATGGLNARVQDCSSDQAVLFTDSMVDDLYIMNLDGTGLRKLVDSLLMPVSAARFSEDGQKIVFVSPDGNKIHTLNRDGSGLHQIPGITGADAAFVHPAQ